MSNINDRDSYTDGRRDEQLRQESNSGVQGVLIGLLLILGIGGIAVALFFFNRGETPIVPVIVPSTTPASPPATENRETIIREKSTEVVPVPVSPAAQPDINITMPSTQPSESSTQPSNEAPPSSPSSTTEPVPTSP
jgi:cytoskeletal protein RodZ